MAKNGMPNQTLATIGPHMAVAGSERMLVGLGLQAERIEPVRQRPDDRVEQPGPGEAGEEGRHRPGQEHQRLHDLAAEERLVEQQRQAEAEKELEERGWRPSTTACSRAPVRGLASRQHGPILRRGRHIRDLKAENLRNE